MESIAAEKRMLEAEAEVVNKAIREREITMAAYERQLRMLPDGAPGHGSNSLLTPPPLSRIEREALADEKALQTLRGRP